MRILVDMDGIVVDLLSKWLRVYNQKWDDNLTIAQVDSWHIHECVTPQCSPEEMLSYIKEPGFFDDLPPLPGAIDGVKELLGMGHSIKFATAPAGPDSARAKLAWIDHYFRGSGLSHTDMFVCHDKSWINADLLIDDKPETLEKWHTTNPGFSATIEYSYNAHVPVDCLAPSCTNTQQAWEHIVRFVKQLETIAIFKRWEDVQR